MLSNILYVARLHQFLVPALASSVEDDFRQKRGFDLGAFRGGELSKSDHGHSLDGRRVAEDADEV